MKKMLTAANLIALIFLNVNGEVDTFGIQKIYPDAPPPVNNWHLTSTNDLRFFEQKPVSVGDGWYTYSNLTQGRIEVLSDTAVNENAIPTYDISKVISKGYLWKPINSTDNKGDWGNIEVTIRYKNVKLGTGSFEAHPEIVPGGFRQTNSTTLAGADKAVQASCEAMSYHFNWYSRTHRVKFEKDSKHSEGYTVDSSNPQSTTGTSAFEGKEVIQKAILYRVPNFSIPGGYAMKLETWVDETGAGNNFKKVLDYLDDGKWGPTQGDNSPCNCTQYVVLNMARVAIGIRVDFMQSFWFKDWSIRSIDPFPSNIKFRVNNVSNDQLTVFPNPNCGKFSIAYKIEDPSQPAEIIVCNCIGDEIRKMITKNNYGHYKTDIDVTNENGTITQGLYLVKITNGNNTVLRKVSVIR
jgi:hypothetical protein